MPRELTVLPSWMLVAVLFLAASAGMARAEGIDPAYDSFLARKVYDIPTKPGSSAAGYTVSTFRDKQTNQAGAVFLGSVGAKAPPPDLADPRYNWIPQKDYGQGAGVNLRVSF
ncbi:hypothetical protein FHS85_002871 [Rhodoligotrophos appendicifer]|uniref:hypothetical protein n=1 Tax=Rhodoligotrophos appendicifer TaxID=987056 RepID=UPI00118497CF|nr:hypothetical protein [Rhodoligotrophos appendicifer]